MRIFRALSPLFLFLFLSLAYAQPARNGDNTALIIIDMQQYFIDRGETQNTPENIRKVNELVQEQLGLIANAKALNQPIVFMEYEGYGPTNPLLTAAVNGYAHTRTFPKTTDGMFESWNTHVGQLTGYLQEKKIGNLVIAGANGGACVEQSISGALENDYNVMAMSRDIADFNYDEFIYPYDNQYTFPARCPAPNTCRFTEVDDLPALAIELARPRGPASVAEDNSERVKVPAARAPANQNQNSANKNRNRDTGATAR